MRPMGRDRVADDDSGIVGALLGMRDGNIGLMRPLGRGTYGDGDLVDGGCGFFQRRGLSLGTLGELICRCMHIVAAALDRQRIVADLQERILQADQRTVEVHPQLFQTAGERRFDLLREIALRQAAETGGELVDGKIDLAVEGALFGIIAAALGIGLSALLLAFGFDANLGKGIFLEDAQRPRHVADLVAAGAAIDRGYRAHRQPDGAWRR